MNDRHKAIYGILFQEYNIAGVRQVNKARREAVSDLPCIYDILRSENKLETVNLADDFFRKKW